MEIVPSFTRDRALFIPALRFLGVELPLILHQGITPDTSPGNAPFGYTVSDQGL